MKGASSDIESCSTQNSQRSSVNSKKSEKIDSKRSVKGIATSPTVAETQSTRSALRSLNELYATQTASETTFEEKSSKPSKSSATTKKKVKKSHKKNSARSIRLRNKPTPLTFHMLEDKPHIAVCQLVLCNISERSLTFKIKCSSGGNIVAAPVGTASIAPHSQFRLRLTWTKVDDLANWDELEEPKLLLITNFMDENEVDAEDVTTHTRLLAKISLAKKCNGANAPVEQLLLDAIGKSTEVSPIQKPMANCKSSEVGANNSVMRQLADFINGLTDRSLVILGIGFIALLILFK